MHFGKRTIIAQALMEAFAVMEMTVSCQACVRSQKGMLLK